MRFRGWIQNQDESVTRILGMLSGDRLESREQAGTRIGQPWDVGRGTGMEVNRGNLHTF